MLIPEVEQPPPVQVLTNAETEQVVLEDCEQGKTATVKVHHWTEWSETGRGNLSEYP